MIFRYLLLASLFPFAFPQSSYPARYGPGYNIGPTKGGNEIVRSETIYTPGPLEVNAPSLLFLWPGLIDNAIWGKGDLIQTVVEGSKYNNLTCKAKAGQWCLAPYVMHGLSYADRGKQVPIDPDAQIKIIYSRTADKKNWVQTTIDMKTGNTIHNYTKGTGKMTEFLLGTEMQGQNQGTTGQQRYTDTIITLASPDPSFGKTSRKKGATVMSELTSEQDGLVWKVKKFEIPAMRQGNNYAWPPI